MKNILLVLLALFIAAGLLGGSFLYKREQQRQERARQAAALKKEEMTITIPEGWKVSDITAYLEKNTGLAKADFTTALAAHERPTISGVTAKTSWEGMLFPDTYKISKPVSANEIIDKLSGNFEKKYAKAEGASVKTLSGYKFKEYNMELTGYEILILASILEKETGRDLSSLENNTKERLLEERRVVAGIFLNRMKIGQGLESDATINYITGKNQAAPSLTDLKEKSPYNTYRNAGLPPTPICNPSLMSLEAAFTPIKTDYFYFLHKQPSGEVVYSKTYEEHVANKFKYLK